MTEIVKINEIVATNYKAFVNGKVLVLCEDIKDLLNDAQRNIKIYHDGKLLLKIYPENTPVYDKMDLMNCLSLLGLGYYSDGDAIVVYRYENVKFYINDVPSVYYEVDGNKTFMSDNENLGNFIVKALQMHYEI